jgi:hypothetical protein
MGICRFWGFGDQFSLLYPTLQGIFDRSLLFFEMKPSEGWKQVSTLVGLKFLTFFTSLSWEAFCLFSWIAAWVTSALVEVVRHKMSFQMSYQTSSFDRNSKSYDWTTFCRQFYVETSSYYWSNANIA